MPGTWRRWIDYSWYQYVWKRESTVRVTAFVCTLLGLAVGGYAVASRYPAAGVPEAYAQAAKPVSPATVPLTPDILTRVETRTHLVTVVHTRTVRAHVRPARVVTVLRTVTVTRRAPTVTVTRLQRVPASAPPVRTVTVSVAVPPSTVTVAVAAQPTPASEPAPAPTPAPTTTDQGPEKHKKHGHGGGGNGQ